MPIAARGGSGELAASCSNSGVVQLYDVAAKAMHGAAFASGCGVSQGLECWATDTSTSIMCVNSSGALSLTHLDTTSLAPTAPSLFSPWLPSPASPSQHTTPRQGLKGPIERFKMSFDGRSVVAGGKDTLMQLWDVEAQQAR